MRASTTRVRFATKSLVVVGACALVLASCGTKPVASERLSGTPALSISVPLSNVGCTLNDVCIAVGTSSASVGPTEIAEVASPKGHWSNLTLPTINAPLVSSLSCSGSTCLIAGTIANRDLLWQFNASDNTVAIASPPAGGNGVTALTCNGMNCALVDNSIQLGAPRISFSTDGGTTWSSPTALTWAQHATVTSLACGTPTTCIASALTFTGQLQVEVTSDGGVTWTQRNSPLWATLASLSCQASNCVGLATGSGDSELVRTSLVRHGWKQTALNDQAQSLACVGLKPCVVVGSTTSGSPWLATVRDDVVTSVALRYVPTNLSNVACGSKVCAAIGVTTVLSLPLTPSTKQ